VSDVFGRTRLVRHVFNFNDWHSAKRDCSKGAINEIDEEDFNLPARLAALGLWSTGDKRYKHGDHVTLLLSPNLRKILTSQNIDKVWRSCTANV